MATSIGQYFQYSCLEDLPPPRQRSLAGQFTRLQRVGHYLSDPMHIDARLVLACGRSASVRIEYAGDAAAWLAGTLEVPSVQEHRLPLLQELWPYQSFSFLFL